MSLNQVKKAGSRSAGYVTFWLPGFNPNVLAMEPELSTVLISVKKCLTVFREIIQFGQGIIYNFLNICKIKA
jgi:hypothetical protein